ncbi:putative methanogen marker protein 4 [Methanomicrobium sp. W14]|uniref:methanogenesis marker protein Mmp4/MtxX n=1 Tax=Methanomicrobium sp. W14 TaxID=2817839 RepID=UPI001AE3287E|nr:methanogenesis marker protein Mmp4/MtxX [Methanomicrobium sp. W14]MBP2133200.1 putative methanogen marker protein 4 [Methanomicrobium sp. W14]
MIIGIGADKNIQKIHDSLEKIKGKAEYVIFSACMPDKIFPGVCYSVSPNPCTDIIKALYSGKIDAAVRGTLPANITLKALKEASGVSSLRRVAFLQTAKGTRFLLAPVGVDEGWTIEEKIEFIRASRPLAKKAGINPKTAVLSGGRTGDLGRHKIVDRTIHDADTVAELTGSDNCEVMIEDAVKGHGIVIAPDGISGNLIFRTLCLLGEGEAHGAPVVNIGKIFVDTSRAGSDYSNAVLLAISLAKN